MIADRLVRSSRYQSVARRAASSVARPSEVERLLGESRLADETRSRKFRVKGRSQRMAENGEALKYIESVLRQLRRASRDHRQLVEQRNRVDVPRPFRTASTTYEDQRSFAPTGLFGEKDLAVRSRGTPRGGLECHEVDEEPRELAEYSVLDAATKLLARRKSYATATMPERIHERTSLTGRREPRYVPAYQGIDTTIIR